MYQAMILQQSGHLLCLMSPGFYVRSSGGTVLKRYSRTLTTMRFRNRNKVCICWYPIENINQKIKWYFVALSGRTYWQSKRHIEVVDVTLSGRTYWQSKCHIEVVDVALSGRTYWQSKCHIEVVDLFFPNIYIHIAFFIVCLFSLIIHPICLPLIGPVYWTWTPKETKPICLAIDINS